MEAVGLSQRLHQRRHDLSLRNLVEAAGYVYITGDETINAAFRLTGDKEGLPTIVNDYAAAIRYLSRAERLRVLRARLVAFIRKLGLYQLAKKIHPRQI